MRSRASHRHRLLPFLAVAACAFLAACTANDIRPESAFTVQSARIRTVFEELIAADNRSDLDGIMRCYSEDVELLPRRGQPVTGQAAVRAHYAALFARERLEVRIEIGEIALAAGTAQVRGHTSGRRVALADGAAVSIDDDFDATLRRDADGEWRIQRLRW